MDHTLLADLARGILYFALNDSFCSLDFFPPSLGACLQGIAVAKFTTSKQPLNTESAYTCLLDTRDISKDATHNFERKATISIFGFNQITIGYETSYFEVELHRSSVFPRFVRR